MLKRTAVLLVAVAFPGTGCGRTKLATSANALPAEVRFLDLTPVKAGRIAFLDDGHNRIATFSLTEQDFVKLFGSFGLSEITAPVRYWSYGMYGDPSEQVFKKSLDRTAESGLHYRRLESNGGGVEVVFDRKESVAHYNYARW